jgi:hypothetical protein
MSLKWNIDGECLVVSGFDDTCAYRFVAFHRSLFQPSGSCRAGVRLGDVFDRESIADLYEFRRATPPVTVRRFAEAETMGFIEPVFAALATDRLLFRRMGREWRLASAGRLRLVCRAWTDPADDLLLRLSLELGWPCARMTSSWLARSALPRWPEHDRASIVPLARLACDVDDVALLLAVHARLRITDSDETLALVRSCNNAARRCLAEILHARPRRLRRARRL